MSDNEHAEAKAGPSLRKVGHRISECIKWGIIVTACIGCFIALFLPGVGSRPPSPNEMKCHNNLKHIALALLNYENTYKCFPPAYTVDKQGRPMHSWRALILPFMDNSNREITYNYNQPWNSPE